MALITEHLLGAVLHGITPSLLDLSYRTVILIALVFFFLGNIALVRTSESLAPWIHANPARDSTTNAGIPTLHPALQSGPAQAS
jgi:hypothetical protein